MDVDTGPGSSRNPLGIILVLQTAKTRPRNTPLPTVLTKEVTCVGVRSEGSRTVGP